MMWGLLNLMPMRWCGHTVTRVRIVVHAACRGLEEVQAAMGACSTSADAPLVAYVSKMVAVPPPPRSPGLPVCPSTPHLACPCWHS